MQRSYTLDEIDRLRIQIRDRWVKSHREEDEDYYWDRSEEKHIERILQTAIIANVEPPKE